MSMINCMTVTDSSDQKTGPIYFWFIYGKSQSLIQTDFTVTFRGIYLTNLRHALREYIIAN